MPWYIHTYIWRGLHSWEGFLRVVFIVVGGIVCFGIGRERKRESSSGPTPRRGTVTAIPNERSFFVFGIVLKSNNITSSYNYNKKSILEDVETCMESSF